MSKIVNIDKLEVVNDKSLVVLDRYITDTILLLNKNGYITTDSCSGRIGSKQLYIAFKHNIDNIALLTKVTNILLGKLEGTLEDINNTNKIIMMPIKKQSGELELYFEYRLTNTQVNSNISFNKDNIESVNLYLYDAFKQAIGILGSKNRLSEEYY